MELKENEFYRGIGNSSGYIFKCIIVDNELKLQVIMSSYPRTPVGYILSGDANSYIKYIEPLSSTSTMDVGK